MTSICREDTREKLDVSSKIKRVGPFLLGPKLGNTPPVKCMTHCLARKEATKEFYTLKILTLFEHSGKKSESVEEQQGKILLCTEHKLLSLLKNEKGIVQHRGLFKEVGQEVVEIEGKLTPTKVTRLCLILDAVTATHDFSEESAQSPYVNLQYYVLKNKKLPEAEAIGIFNNMVQIVQRLHKANIVHRDLKLGNFTLNLLTKEVILSNFCLGKELESEDQLLKDQRGSPAYISPEVISGKAYHGKPSDMWALGVAFFTMLYGQFPFSDANPQELFRKIKILEYKFPGDTFIGITSVSIIGSLLLLNPNKRLTASELSQKLQTHISCRNASPTSPVISDLQVVPDITRKRSHLDNSKDCVEPSKKVAKYQSLFDIEEILMANASQLDKDENDIEELREGVHEAPSYLKKLILESGSGLRNIKCLKVKEDARVLTFGDLEKLYTIYMASKAKGVVPRVNGGIITTTSPTVGQLSANHNSNSREFTTTETVPIIESRSLPNDDETVTTGSSSSSHEAIKIVRQGQATGTNSVSVQ